MIRIIFKAEVKNLDQEYHQIATDLRQRALQDYGCIRFESSAKDNLEIAISEWPTMKEIENWRQDEFHISAQKKAQEKWYKSYTIEMVVFEK